MQGSTVIIKGVGTIRSNEGKAFLLTLLSIEEYHTLRNYIDLCFLLNIIITNREPILKSIKKLYLPLDVLYSFGSCATELCLYNATFTLASVIKLVCNYDVNTDVKLRMTTSSVELLGVGSIDRHKAEHYMNTFLTAYQFWQIKNWLAMCRVLSIRLEGTVTQAHIELELSKLGLDPSVLHILGTYYGKLKADGRWVIYRNGSLIPFA